MDYLQRKDIARAKQKLLFALKQDPNLPEAWYSMGYFLEATGDKVEAKKYYLHAVTLAPNQGAVQNNYGTFLCRNGEPKAAIQHFLLAVKDSDYLDTGAAYENAGLCALDIPNRNLATTYFNQAVRQDPNRPMSLMELAQLSYKQGNYSEARSWLDSFLAVSPPTPASNLLSSQIAHKKT
jgi:type IV pilus assembly protein PilF